jgi:mono/diheme cytochrome c family protein
MKIRLAFITSVMYAMFMLSSCGNTEQNKEHAQREHSHDSVVENHSHDHGGHSQQMNETREWLKAELGEKYNQSVPIATVKHLDQGKIIYTQYCVICHGSSGKGDGQGAAALQPKPADFTDPEHSSFYSEQGRIYIIKKGIKGTAMIAWENTLNEEEIFAVYAYVNSLKSSENKEEHHEHQH